MKNKKHTPLLAALATLVVLLAGVVLIWLAKVRPDVGKGRSEIVTDFLRAELLQDGQTATQVFTYDKDILTIGLEFYLPGDQPCGALDVVLYDADTGEELSRSVGTMDYIVPDQYTTLGMDPAVTGREGRRYKLAVTPHYATDAILAIGHSDGVALWKEQMAVDDRVIDGTIAMQITYQRIGGYLTRFFLLVALDVHLAARLGEREVVRAEARDRAFAVQLLHDGVERTLEVRHRHALVDDHALDLMEHGGVGSVHLVLAVHPAGGDHADGYAVLLHGPDLHGRSLGPQEIGRAHV